MKKRRQKGRIAAENRREQAKHPMFNNLTVEQLRDFILEQTGAAGEELRKRGAILIVGWRGEAVGLPSFESKTHYNR